jgi:MFS superfamily sulfate permease-like transporter
VQNNFLTHQLNDSRNSIFKAIMQILPKTGLQGLVQNWQSDLLAAISVAFVALPLALGIALASGAPPMAGILSAVVGGVVTTLYRGSHVAINGPAAGLIAVVLASIASLDDGSGQALNYALAAIVISGGLQIVFGLLKLGRYADIFHPTVIKGILAAIGIIIIAKQIHLALGTGVTSDSIVDDLVAVFTHIKDINPFVAIISLLGLLLLLFSSKINYKFFHFLPAPIWVLALAIPLVYAFNYFDAHSMDFFGRSYDVGPDLLVSIPDNLMDAIAHPNFAKIGTIEFWMAVISICMISSISSLASSKAVDRLDPYRRRTDLNKDLIGIGMSTMVSGALGGLPIVTVIVRSTVNVHNHAKTKWSNMYHGILLAAIIFLLAPIIQQVPLCALAILLVYTGFKLASLKVIKQVYRQGVEQLIFFIGTIVIAIFTDILIGIFGGLLLALLTHLLMSKISPVQFFILIFKSGSNVFEKKDGSQVVKIKGIANFLGYMNIDSLLKQIPSKATVEIDLSEARLVDLSVMEQVHEFQRNHTAEGGNVTVAGLDQHVSSSNHKMAMRILKTEEVKLGTREISLKQRAEVHGWDFSPARSEDVDYFGSFYYFKSRPIEFKSNCISHKEGDLEWSITDLTFDDGASIALEEFHTTLCILKFSFEIPKFTIEKKGLYDRYMHITDHKDIDYTDYKGLSKGHLVKVENESEMDEFLTDELKAFFVECDIHHFESNGEAILVFNKNLKVAKIKEHAEIITCAQALHGLIKPKK